VRNTRFWNKFHLVRSKTKDWRVKFFKNLWKQENPKWPNRLRLPMHDEDLEKNRLIQVKFKFFAHLGISILPLSTIFLLDFWNCYDCVVFFVFLFISASPCFGSAKITNA
jgi:hypothetical protein